MCLARGSKASSDMGVAGKILHWGSAGGFSALGRGSTLLFANSIASDCHANSRSGTLNGGGGAFFTSDGSTIIVIDSAVIGCTAHNGGAFALFAGGGTVELTRSLIEACSATEQGGGVHVWDSLSVFRSIGSSFVGCSCPNGKGGVLAMIAGRAVVSGGRSDQCVAKDGGAMYARGGQLEVSDHMFTACSSAQYGGVLYINHETKGSQATLTGCIIINATGYVGGAVSVDKGLATIKECVVEDSSAEFGGSFSVQGGGELSLLRTNVSGSEAGTAGGVLAIALGYADVQGCEFSRGFSGGPGGSVVMSSGTLRIVESVIRESKTARIGVGAAVHVMSGSLELHDIQILSSSVLRPDYSEASANGSIIYVSKQAIFHAALLRVEVDCSGTFNIQTEDSERVLDITGYSILDPSLCATSAQLSNAKLSGCSDHSACGVAAECVDRPVAPFPSFMSPECSCTGLNYPQPSATSTALAPYVRGSSGGCATPRQAERVWVVGEAVGTVVIELHKGRSIDAIPAENITLATRMTGSGVSSATWTSAVRYLPTSVPAWVQLQLGDGFIPVGDEQIRLWIVATSSGLAERSEAYQAHLDLSVISQNNVTLTVPIFLTVSASTVAAVWGTVLENGRCTEALGAVTSMTHSLDDQINLHFVACDVEMLPVHHRLPSERDPREFSVIIRHAGGEALEEIDFGVTIDVTSPGKYVVQLKLFHLAEYTVQLVLADKPVAIPLSITTECPVGRVPYGHECGCAQGTTYNGDSMVCVACPPNTFNNRTMRTDEQLACTKCPKHSVSPAASTSAAMCQCSEGFYATTADGLVYGEGDCCRCPLGTACDSFGHSTLTLPVIAGWWRASNTSVDIKRCADHDAEEGSGCVGGPGAWSCKESLRGPLCVLCKDGPGHYYNKDIHECRECDAGARGLTIIAMLGTALGFALISGTLLHYCSLPVAKACKPKQRVLRTVWECVRSFLVKVSCTANVKQSH